ncbi:methyltransferase domain-containing protein [Chelatococcus reniformis]|uniref:methyltransferase domain-containing protein n=1 Tax=Chelatococcus reniformis TaxID=1494448 RepID=UPI00166A7019|nr:class I SAM-dependent methyltransferase [Chelatococcus reniformis]
MTRLERMVGSPLSTDVGLEIGPRDAPLLHKPHHNVRYVDYAPTEIIKASQFDPSVKIENIVDVDIVWGDVRLRSTVGEPVDYVVASHVIEHVPDLIGWLIEIAEVLRPGGTLGLAIPDKRFTFDALRQVSTLSQAVEAYLLRSKQPSLRQVFDTAALGVAIDLAEAWEGRLDPSARRSEVLSRLQPALQLATSLHESPRYNDAHCWVFTPASFLDLVEEFATLGLFPFMIADLEPTRRGALEFLVRLERPGSASDDAIFMSIEMARSRLASAPGVEAGREEAEKAEAERGKVEREHRTALEQARLEIHHLKTQIAALEASTSWKITAPLRKMGRVLRRKS